MSLRFRNSPAAWAAIVIAASLTAVPVSAQKPSPTVSASNVTTPARVPGSDIPRGEPREIAGMLAQQNAVRARLGLPLLSWSDELADKARAPFAEAHTSSCMAQTVDTTARDSQIAYFLAAPLRMIGSGPRAQVLTATSVVSEWSAGKSAMDPVTRACDRFKPGGRACESYARMTFPAARKVGCAKMVCQTAAQIWACSYDAAPASSTPKPKS